MTKSSLRNALSDGKFIVAPGIHDMITAVICNRIGFDFVYASGYWSTASAYGLPDAGIASYTQMLDRVATLSRTSTAGVIADADTGYGGLLNVHHTVRGFEEAGVTAIQLEDQEFPKKCGHTRNKRVIGADDMCTKIKVALEGRQNPDTMIIARTDAKQPEGFDKALERAIRYADAGADMIFFEALTSEEEMRLACREVPAPMVANMANGGITPILPAKQLEDIGYAMAIFPAMTGLAAARAVERALTNLKQTGHSLSPEIDLFDFSEFNSLIGFEDVWAFEKKWGSDSDD